MANEVLGNLQWGDENGDLIEAHLHGLYNLFEMMSQGALSIKIEETFCLQFIDPYGDTIFNQVQIPILIEELKSLLVACQEHEKKQEFEVMVNFIEKARGEVHTYIKFYGN